jgi:hypothetical protein
MAPLCRSCMANGLLKTLVVGEVGAPIERDGESVVQTHTLSYFSRLAEAEAGERLTLGEL